MIARELVWGVVLLLVTACGGQTSEGEGSSPTTTGGASGGSMLSGGAPAGGAASGGAGGSAGDGGEASATGGSRVLCLDGACDLPCSHGFWEDLDGCPACACAPPPLRLEPFGRLISADLTTPGGGSAWSPGSGRIDVSLTWTFDDPASDDEEETVSVYLETFDGAVWGTVYPRTYFVPEVDPWKLGWGYWRRWALARSRYSSSSLGATSPCARRGSPTRSNSVELEATDGRAGTTAVGGSFVLPVF